MLPKGQMWTELTKWFSPFLFLPFFFSLFSVLLTGQQRCRPRQVRRWCGGCRRCWQPVRRQPRLLRRSFASLCIYMNLHPTRTHPLVPPHLPLSLVPPHAHTLAQWQTTLPERQSSHSVYCTECKWRISSSSQKCTACSMSLRVCAGARVCIFHSIPCLLSYSFIVLCF